MTDKLIRSKTIAAAPIVMVAVLTASYIVFHMLYVRCDFFLFSNICQPVAVSLVFQKIDEPVNIYGNVLVPTPTPTPTPGASPSPTPSATPGDKTDPAITAITQSRKLVAARFNGRNMWVFLMWVSTIACIGALIVASVLIRNSTSFRGEKTFTRIGVLLAISILLGLVFWFWRDYMTDQIDILKSTIAAGHLGLSSVAELMRFSIAFTFAATFALIFATCAILLPRERAAIRESADISKERAEVQRGLEPLAGQMTDLRTMLYAGTILLIVGVLRLSAVYQWSLAFISQNDLEAAKVFTSSLVTDTGGFFTLIIASVYIPAAYIINRRAELLVMESDLELKEKEEILNDQKINFSFKDSLPRLLVILGPLLAGPIGELIKGL